MSEVSNTRLKIIINGMKTVWRWDVRSQGWGIFFVIRQKAIATSSAQLAI
ncbi:MAG: hypothetical protein MUF49_29190 [Oculatellaceae cyanobacterium Prado106]|nr:hypothetical protein [Oculatellaceae cyanobacterium Prado106]